MHSKIQGARGIADDVLAEVERSATKFPEWPSDPFHALAVIGEEYGELQQAVLQTVYEPEKGVTDEDIRTEAVQAAAMLIRFIVSFDRDEYEYEVEDNGKPPQHEQ